MEYLNKIELRGIIGNVKPVKVGDATYAVHFTLATNYAYRSIDGTPIVDVSWHDITAWVGKDISLEAVSSLKKGDAVEVVGRLKTQSYTSSNGEVRSCVNVIANKVVKLSEQ